MDLKTLYNSPKYDYLLISKNWQKADFYALESNNVFWNKSIIINLPKEFAKNNTEALIYLLLKEAKELNICKSEWNINTPKTKQFIEFVVSEGGITNTLGKIISNSLFYEIYIETIENLKSDPSFEFSKNNKIEMYSELINLKYIQKVICFDNSWKEHNFLIEAKNNWFFYHWNSND